MGIIKAILRVLFAFGLPGILVFGLWTILDPVTYWQTLTTMVVGIVVYFMVMCATVTLAAEW